VLPLAQLPEQEAADGGRDDNRGDVADRRDVQVTQPAEDVTHEDEQREVERRRGSRWS
jgi:hypothetical protein